MCDLSMIEMIQKSGGVLLSIQAHPRARKEAIVGVHAGRLKVAVRQAPERGKANAAVLRLLAGELGLRPSQLRIVAGETSPRKTVWVDGLSVENLRSRLAAVLSERDGSR